MDDVRSGKFSGSCESTSRCSLCTKSILFALRYVSASTSTVGSTGRGLVTEGGLAGFLMNLENSSHVNGPLKACVCSCILQES